MLAKRTEPTKKSKDLYADLVPERMFVQNEVLMLITLHREQRHLTAFEIEKGVAVLKGDESRSVQVGAGLKQLIEADLVETEMVPDTKTKRQVTKFYLTEKGSQTAELFLQMFKLWKS